MGDFDDSYQLSVKFTNTVVLWEQFTQGS